MSKKITCLLIAFILLVSGLPVNAAENAYCNCCPDETSNSRIYFKDPPFTGDEVAELQRALQTIGLYKGPLDGVFGRQMELAVKKFQKTNNLPDSGCIDEPTRRALSKYFEKPVSTEPGKDPKGVVRLEIHIKTRTLVVYDDEKPFKTFKVGVGKYETPSPIGEWQVTRKAKNWGTGFGTRWMGLSVPWGIYGIHGTNKPWSIGTRASHGCFRMFNKDVEELYQWVKPGTKVTVIGQVYPVRYEDRLVLRRGYKGSDVYHVQLKLKELGYLKGTVDGIYGPATIGAVKKFQEDHGFPVTGELDIDVYPAIGL